MSPDSEWEFLGDISESSDAVFNLESDTTGDIPTFTVGLEDAVIDPIQGDGQCITCGAPTFRPPGLTPGGNRRRVPKFCDDHDPKRQARNERVLKERGIDPALSRVAEELADDIRLFGTMAGYVYPVTGYYLLDNADAFTVALVKLASKNTRLLRVLHRAAQVAPVYTVAQTLVGTAVAVQVDMNKMDAHSFAAERTGVDKAFDAVYPDGKEGQSFAKTEFNTEQPPVFHRVG